MFESGLLEDASLGLESHRPGEEQMEEYEGGDSEGERRALETKRA